MPTKERNAFFTSDLKMKTTDKILGYLRFDTLAVFAGYLIVLAGFLISAEDAVAEQKSVECDALVNKALETGLTPSITIDASWGIVRITTPEIYCREPVETWNDRGLSWIPEETRKPEASDFLGPADKETSEILSNETKNASPPLTTSTTPRLPTVILKPELMVDPGSTSENSLLNLRENKLPPQPKKYPCSLKIEEVWSAGYHRIEMVDYLLSEIHTVDGNRDGVADNLKFILQADDHFRMTVRYFDTKARRTARDIPGLRLSPGMEVSDFCLNQISYTTPIKTAGKISIAPGLAGKASARIHSRKNQDTKLQRSGTNLEQTNHDRQALGLWLGVCIALLGSGVAWLFYSHSSVRTRNSSDDAG
jgi:hypothetical protein